MVIQESAANIKVSMWQQCTYEGS